jgi:hypothetical protein
LPSAATARPICSDIERADLAALKPLTGQTLRNDRDEDA